VTVHKAEGVTVDRAVLLADGATTREHLYVGMTRGRHDNRVCVVTDAASTGHGHQPPPTPIEILTTVMRRSSADLSATETMRAELDRGEDRETLRRLHEQSRAHIEACAGPDRRSELRRLHRLRSTLPMMRDILAVNEREVARLDRAIARTRHGLADAHHHLEALTRPRRFRRLDQPAIDDTQHRIGAKRYLERLQTERASSAAQLERSRHRLRNAENAVARIPDVEAAITRRSNWLLGHPAELAWEADLATRLANTAAPTNNPAPITRPTLPTTTSNPTASTSTSGLSTSLTVPPEQASNASCERPLGSGTPGNPKLGSHPFPVEASRALISAAEQRTGHRRARTRRLFPCRRL
jgi:hypothetical protein